MSLNLQKVSLRISAGNESQFPTDPIPQIAFSGRSNVGKSSLINTLLGRKSLARVSGTPGKTITINFYDVDRQLFLTDLPGYGFAARTPDSVRAWSRLTDGYFTRNKNIDLVKAVVQLIDSRACITDNDRQMLSFMNGAGIPYLVVITKIDKLNKTERAACIEKVSTDPALLPGITVIPFSSANGEGKPQLWREISQMSGVRL